MKGTLFPSCLVVSVPFLKRLEEFFDPQDEKYTLAQIGSLFQKDQNKKTLLTKFPQEVQQALAFK